MSENVAENKDIGKPEVISNETEEKEDSQVEDNQDNELNKAQEELVILRQQNKTLEEVADKFNMIVNDPDFIEFATNKLKGSQSPQAKQVPDEYEPSIDLDQFEDADGAKIMIKEIAKANRVYVDSAIGELKNMLQPLIQDASRNSQANEYTALKGYAEKNGLTDPDTIRKEIDLLRKAEPNLSLLHAYEIANARHERSLIVKPPLVNRGNIKSIKNPVNPPSGSLSRQPSAKDTEGTINELLENRLKNKGRPATSSINIKNVLAEVMKEQGIDPDSL